MQTVTFREVFDDVLTLARFEPAALTNIDQNPYKIVASFIEARCREAIDRTRWREWIVTEERVADANGLISFDQNGENRIGLVYGVYLLDPTSQDSTSPRPLPQDYIPTADGIVIYQGASKTLWVQYRRAAPRFTTRYYQAAPNTYNLNEVVYWPNTDNTQTAGQCYELRYAANGTDPRWDEQLILRVWKPWLVNAAFADWLQNDGQRERAMQHLNEVARPELDRAAAANSNVQGLPMQARVMIP